MLYAYSQQCFISLKVVINDNYYCCHDCYIGAKMIEDGFPYKFVTLHENKEYFCFLRKEETIKEMINDFLIVILGSKFSSSQDYGAKIIFSGKKQTHDLMTKNIFQIKKDNNVMFTMSKRTLSDIQGKSIFSRQSASNSNEIVKISDNKHSMTNMNTGKSFWSTDVVDIPQVNNVNIPISNDGNSTITKDVVIPANININIPNKNIINTKTNIPAINQSELFIDKSKIVSPNNNNHVTKMLNTVKLNSTITKNVDLPTKININVPNGNIINIKTNIPAINQSELSVDESKIVFSNNNNHVTKILNTVTLNSTITKDVDIPAKINIKLPNEKIINTKTNIPKINISELSIDESKIVCSNNNNHVTKVLNTVILNSTITKDVDIPAKINIKLPNKKILIQKSRYLQ